MTEILKCWRSYRERLHSLPPVTIIKLTLKYASIDAFIPSTKKNNDKNNKMREAIVSAIINSKIPPEYYKYSRRWRHLKTIIDTYCRSLATDGQTYDNIECTLKAGRGNNYDFDITLHYPNQKDTFNIELKFNAGSIDAAPQFVSPMKPSQYLDESYESYFYEDYLEYIMAKLSLPMPSQEIYLKQIHSEKPACMTEYQNLYYQGCSRSSQYTGVPNAISFYIYCKHLTKASIANFIETTELKTEKLTKYLQSSQKDKIYMLYKHNKFIKQSVNMDDYIITGVVAEPSKSRYICNTKSGKKIKVLLRWKNGHGIALPAFQI